MEVPSILCLRALRRLTSAPRSCYPFGLAPSHRCYASSQQKTKPSPPSNNNDPLPSIKDDEEQTLRNPQILSHPLGLPSRPKSRAVGGTGPSLSERRDSFVNYDKHLERRAKMTAQIRRPYFRDWSNLRFHRGKVFLAPPRLLRAETAKYFPNFFGKTLRKDAQKSKKKDGYGGLGRNVCEALKGKISVVGVMANRFAAAQVETWWSPAQNPGVRELLDGQGDNSVAQKVEINIEDNRVNWWILQLFGTGSLRQGRSAEEQGLYFMVQEKLDETMKEVLGMANAEAGYVYLVDKEGKIRWAGSADADAEEKESLVKGLGRLIQEAKTPQGKRPSQKQPLEKAVDEVLEKPRQGSASS